MFNQSKVHNNETPSLRFILVMDISPARKSLLYRHTTFPENMEFRPAVLHGAQKDGRAILN